MTFQVSFSLLPQQLSKKYVSEEEEVRRMNIWAMNKKYVEMHNANADLYGFTTGMNEYADLVSGCSSMKWAWLQ